MVAIVKYKNMSLSASPSTKIDDKSYLIIIVELKLAATPRNVTSIIFIISPLKTLKRQELKL